MLPAWSCSYTHPSTSLQAAQHHGPVSTLPGAALALARENETSGGGAQGGRGDAERMSHGWWSRGKSLPCHQLWHGDKAGGIP